MERLTAIAIITLILNVVSQYSAGQTQFTDSIYRVAVEDAIRPSLDESYDGLIPIIKSSGVLMWRTFREEDHVLMAHVIDTDSYHRLHCHRDSVFNTNGREVWVTAVPEFRKKFSDFGVQTDTVMRVRQLFGFPPVKRCEYVIEFWVKPKDMFRPCPDPEIDDTACDLCSTSDTTHVEWMNSNRLWSYYKESLHKQYPWTQLGYTYDWNPESSEVGLSEFVIRKNSEVKIHSIYTLHNYLSDSCTSCKCD